MSSRFTTRRRGQRGFSLVEMVVSLLILVLVMIVALSLLFAMKSFAERQQVKTAPRQTSRRAADYLSYFIAGATDLNDAATPRSPNAIVTWYSKPGPGGAPVLKQASYNDLTPAQSALGEVGTDIITVAVPSGTAIGQFASWPGVGNTGTATIDYLDGCPDNATLQANFEQLTGAHVNGSGKKVSELMTVVDANGAWSYYRITNYLGYTCGSLDPGTGEPNPVQVSSDPAGNGEVVVNPPGGPGALAAPVTLIAGMRFYSFRVRRAADDTLSLEQKQGLFDPDTDNPGNAFVPILPDVEDFQVAYLYSTPPAGGGTVFNTIDPATGNVVLVDDSAFGTNVHVPPQGSALPWDVTNVAGLRFSITSRSAALRFTTSRISVRRKTATETNVRPASEDRPAGNPDDYEKPGATTGARVGDFDHFRITSTLALRNRMLGN